MRSVLISPAGLEEGAQAEPDIVIGSLLELPEAIANLNSPKFMEIRGLLGNRCEFCFTEGVNLYRLDPKGGEDIDNYALLCPKCRKEASEERIQRPRKRGKYRAVYRRSWRRSTDLYRHGKSSPMG